MSIDYCLKLFKNIYYYVILYLLLKSSTSKRKKGDSMIGNRRIEKYLWISTMVFITFLLVGSFVLGRDVIEVSYVGFLYLMIAVCKYKK